MPRWFPASLLAAVLLLAPSGVASAQTRTAAESAAEGTAREYLARNAARHGLGAADVSELVVTDVVTSARSGVRHVYLRQALGGVPVAVGGMTVNVAPDGRVVHATGELVAGLGLRAARSAAALSPAQAAQALAAELGWTPTEAFRTAAAKTAGAPGVYLTDGGVAAEPVPAALVYDADDAGRVVLAYEVGLAERGAPHYWLGTVDASTGRVLRVRDLVVHCTFSGDDPAAVAERAGAADAHEHAGHTHTAAPAAVPMAAPAAASGLAPFADAARAAHGAAVPAYRVYAAPVISPLYTAPLPPADARTLVVNPADPTASPLGWHATPSAAYTGARGNNVWAYVDATDSDSPDPTGQPDGGAGLVFDFPLDLTQAPSTYREAAVTNLFYWSNLLHDVLYHYGFTAAAGNFQADGLGLGGAPTDDAVRAEAQDGGGSLNANFYTPPDGGCGALGCVPRMQMYLGTNATPAVDGDFDNHVIAHEYVHGLSIRKTGGPTTTTCLSNSEQMGEGWSDWYGLLLTMDADDQATDARGVGQYLFYPQRPAGIRPAPYSTSFAVNDYTYGRTRSGMAVPHGIGFVWATALWEMTWELIGAHGFEPNLTLVDSPAGNIVALNLVTEALRMQPCSPGFVQGRDAILAADLALYDGAHAELLWRAFARRGLGLGASQGSSDSNGDNTESFVEPEEIAPSDVTDLAAVPDGDAVTLTFTATGDDGPVGTAALYSVRYASAPILTDADWAAATSIPITARPRAAGQPEALLVPGLAFGTAYHFALRVTDESFNQSGLSNSAAATTLAAPAATVPTAALGVTTDSTATATLTLANAGPSTLRWSLGLAEAARQAPPFDLGAPAAEADKDAADAPAPEAARRGQGGPDAFGYRWIDSNEPGGPTFSWTSIAATGTALSLSDDDAELVPIGFAFPFYGADHTSVHVTSNGMLAFGARTTSYTNVAIPSAETPNQFVAGYWDDLNPAAGGTVHYQTVGGTFVVQYTGVPRYTSGTGAVTMQIILTPGGVVTVQYLAVPSTNNSATIGLENPNGTDGLQVAFNAPYAAPNLAVRFSALWVEADLAAGTIPAGATQEVVLTFDAAGLAEGLYEATMTVSTNDPQTATTVIPVTLQVGQITADEGTAEAFAGTHRLSGVRPNPAAGRARLSLAVAEAQDVRAELYDALGRRVAVAFDGALAPGVETALEVDVRGLAAGTYVLRVAGATFAETRRLTVAR